MYNKIIKLLPDQLNLPLSPINVMRYSSGKLLFDNFSPDFTAGVMVIRFGTDDPIVIALDVDVDRTCEFTIANIENGVHATVGQGNYWIYGFVGTRCYGLGAGTYTVLDAPTLSATGTVTSVGNTTYVYNPTDGLYYLLTATTNSDGDVTIEVADEGVTL